MEEIIAASGEVEDYQQPLATVKEDENVEVLSQNCCASAEKVETLRSAIVNEKQAALAEGNGFKPKMEELLRHLQPKDLKKILDKVSGRHRRHHSWTQSSEHEDKDTESRFVTPLQDHDEMTRCMECNRKHTTPNGLFWHLDVNHKWSFQLTRLKATTTCPICNVFCGHWYNMSLHVIQAHGQRNWWKEADESIMLIQPAQTDMEESVTKLDKPVDRRLALIFTQSMNRHSSGYLFGSQDTNVQQQMYESNLTMHDSVDTMVKYGSMVLPDKIDEEQAEQEEINSPFEQAQHTDSQILQINDSEAEECKDGQVSSVSGKAKKVSSRGLSFRFWGAPEDKTTLTVKSGSLSQPIAS